MSVIIYPDTGNTTVLVNPNTGLNIIVERDNANSFNITGFVGSSHNDLLGKQGGVTGQFYHLSQEQYLRLTTGEFVSIDETGQFYPTTNPSGFITGVDLSSYATINFVTGISGDLQGQVSILNEQTGDYVLKLETGNFITQTVADNLYVNVTGSETISGTKSFVNDVNVPNLFATGGISGDSYQLDTGSSLTANIGQFVWNNTDGTADLKLKGGNVTLQLGQEQLARVVNGSTGDLLESNFQVVKVIGAQGQRLQVDLARADSDLHSESTLGIVTENITKNQEGFITTFGEVHDINTLSVNGETWHDGDVLYLSPTVSGRITNVEPQAPNHRVVVGFVEYAHAVHGKIYVKIDNGISLNELHDVRVSNVQNGQIIKFNSGSGIWLNDTLSTGDVSGISSYATIAYATGISGYLGSQIVDLQSKTGSYVTGSVIRPSDTGQFYASSNPSGYITGISNIVFTTGNQTITGVKNFTAPPTISGNQIATVIDPVRTSVTGDGVITSFNISGASGLVNPSALIVAIDGTLQEPVVDYTVNTGAITFTSPVPSGSKAVIVSPINILQVSQMIPADGSVTTAKLDNSLTVQNLTVTSSLSSTGNIAGSGTNNTLPNQTATTNSSILNLGLADARYFNKLRNVTYSFSTGWTSVQTTGGSSTTLPSHLRVNAATSTNAGACTTWTPNGRMAIGVNPQPPVFNNSVIDFTNPIGINIAFNTGNFNIPANLNFAFLFGQTETFTAGLSAMVKTGSNSNIGWVGIQCVAGNVTIIAVNGTSAVQQSSVIDTCVNGRNQKAYRLVVSGGRVDAYNSSGTLLGSLLSGAPTTNKDYWEAILVEANSAVNQIGINVQHLSLDW